MLATQPNTTSGSATWVVDSGATQHMCNEIGAFKNGTMVQTRVSVHLGDRTTLQVTQQGTAVINNVEIAPLFIPEFRISLLSVPQFDIQGMMTVFSAGICIVSNASQTVIRAPLIQGLYRVLPHVLYSDGEALQAIAAGRKYSQKKPIEVSLWHRRLAHINPSALDKVLGKLPHLGTHDQACEICLWEKAKQTFTRTRVPRTTTPFELVHSDLCGPFTPSAGG